MRRCLSFLFLSLFIQGVSAADYYWRLSYGTYSGTGSSPEAAYQDACSRSAGCISNGFNKPSQHTITKSSPTAYIVREYFPSGILNQTMTIVRSGDTCPPDHTLNDNTDDPTLPICTPPEPDKCEAKLGQSDNFIVGGLQFKMCRDNCELALDSVQPFKRSATSETIYHFFGVYTGESCQTNTSIIPGVAPPEPTESDRDEECTATSVTFDGEGRRHETSSCTTTTTDLDNQACIAKGGSVGEFQGVMQCVNKGNGPKATETKQEVKQETKQNPDGSKTETKTTTTNVTVCSGAKSCITTTTTTTATTKTNADGTSGGSTSSCKGVNCADGKEGDGKGKGKGDGEEDGKGDEDGPCDPARDYCGQAPSTQLQPGEQGNFDEGNAVWDQKLADIKTELDEKIEQYSSSFKGLFDINLGSGGGALPCDTVNVSFGRFGSTSLRLCLNDYAEQLSYLRYALLLAASVIAALVVLRD
ncbi:hypothetical protein [Aquipseudomonas campi]